MSILVNKNTRVVTQGITGATGQFHTKACKEYGTQMVAGVTPGKGGTDFEGIPIFDTVGQAVKQTGANASDLAGDVARHVRGLCQRIGRAPDRAILGCTHYEIIADMFRAALPPGRFRDEHVP